MSLHSWEGVLVHWVNCLKLLEYQVEHIKELKNGQFFVNVLNLLDETPLRCEKPEDTLEIVNIFLKREYPGFYMEVDQSEEEIIYLCSIFLFHCVVKAQSHTVMDKMFTLSGDMQIHIRNFLEKLLQNTSFNRDILQEAIAEHQNCDAKSAENDSFNKDSPALLPFSSTPKRKPRVMELLESPVAQQMKLLSEQKRELGRLKTELEQEQAEKSEMQECIKELEARVNQQAQLLNQKNAEIKKLREEMCEMYTTPKKGEPLHESLLKDEVKSLEKCVSSLHEEIGSLQEEKDALTMKLAKLEGQCGFWQTKAKEAIARSELLEQDLKDKEHQLLQLRDTCNDLEAFVQETKRGRSRRSSDFECSSLGRWTSPGSRSGENLGTIIDLQLQEKEEENAALRNEVQSYVLKEQELRKEVQNFQEQLKAAEVELQSLKAEHCDLLKKVEKLATVEEQCANLQSQLSNKDLELNEHICTLNKLQVASEDLHQKYRELQSSFDIQTADLYKVKSDAEKTATQLEQKSHECLTLLQESLRAKERIEFVERELNLQIKMAILIAEAECLEKSEALDHVDINMEESLKTLSTVLQTLKIKINDRNDENLKLKLAYQNLEKTSAAQCEQIESLYTKQNNFMIEQSNLKSELEHLKKHLEENKTTLQQVQLEKDTLFLQFMDLRAENQKQSLMLKKLEDLEKQVDILEAEKFVLNNCNLGLESKINEILLTQHSLEKNMMELKQQHEKEVAKTLNDVSCLEAKNDNLEKVKLQLETDIASLKKQLQVSSDERNELSNQNYKYNQQILHMTSEIESVRLHLRNVENDSLQAKVDLEVTRKLYAEVKGSKDALEEQLHKRIADCNVQMTVLENEKASLQSKLEDLIRSREAEDACTTANIDELNRNVESLTQENCMKTEELIKVKAEFEEIKENLKKCNQDISEKQGIIDELIEMKETCSQQVNELSKQLSLLKHELETTRLESEQIKERKDREIEILCREKDEEIETLQVGVKETKEERNDLRREIKMLEKQNKELIEKCKDVEAISNSLQEVKLKLASTLELKNNAEESKLKLESSNLELKMSLKLYEENLEKLKGAIKEHKLQHLNYEEMCVKFSQETCHIKECFTSVNLMEDKLEDNRRELCRSLDELALNVEALASDMSVGYSELLAIQYQQTEIEEIFSIIQVTYAQILQKIRDVKFATFERIAEYAELHSKSMCIMDATVTEHDLLPVKPISYKELLKYEDLKLSVHTSTKELKSEMSNIISVLENLCKKCNTLVCKCQSLDRREPSLLLGSSQGSVRNLTSETSSRYMRNFLECIRKQSTELGAGDDDGWNLDDSLESPQEVTSSTSIYEDKFSLFSSPTLNLNIQRKVAFNVRVRKELRRLNEEISLLKKQNESLKLFLQDEQKSNEELKRNLAELEESNRIIKSEKEDALAMKTELESKISMLESDLSQMNSYRVEASQLKEVCKSLSLKCDELKSQLAKNETTPSGSHMKYTEQDMTESINGIRLSYREKLENLKLRMKGLFNEELEGKTRKLKEEVSKLQALNKQYKEKIASYEENMKILQSQEWEIGDRYLVAKEENKRYEDMIKASKQHLAVITAEEQDGDNRMENISERKQSMTLSQEWQKKMNLSVVHSMDVIDESLTYTRRQSIYKSLPSGMLFSAEDEEGEEFNTTNLADLKAGRCQPPAVEGNRKARLSELQFRNSLCPPHLKSSYPAETQFYDPRDYKDEDLKLGCAVDVENFNTLSTSLLLPGEKHHKKDKGQTAYMRPGPPTPGKNCRRHSLQGAECLTPRAPLRESNDGASVRRVATPNRLRSLFTKNNRRNDENSPVTPRARRISNLFRKPPKNNH